MSFFLEYVVTCSQIDECNRMWMVDNGYLENETPVCSPKLIAFNLLTDSLVAWVAIPNEIANSSAGEYLFTNVIVETEGLDCEFTTVSKINCVLVRQ